MATWHVPVVDCSRRQVPLATAGHHQNGAVVPGLIITSLIEFCFEFSILFFHFFWVVSVAFRFSFPAIFFPLDIIFFFASFFVPVLLLQQQQQQQQEQQQEANSTFVCLMNKKINQ